MGTGTELEKILRILAENEKEGFVETNETPIFEFTIEVDPKPYEIESVKSFDDKTTVVFFKDGTKEVAVCTEDDTYSLEQGISVCLAKKLVGGKKNYNRIIKTAAKQYRDERKAAKKAQEEKQKTHEERMRVQQNRAEKKKKKQRVENTAMIAGAIVQALQILTDADVVKIGLDEDK